MLGYLLIRLFRWVTGLLLILFVSYAMMYFGAGDPVKRMFMDLDDGPADAVMVEQVRQKYGLDEPFPVQFVNYLGRLAQGDLGVSIRQKRPVADMVRATLPISIQLGVAATILATVIGLPLGAWAASRHNTRVDYSIVGSITGLSAVPVYVLGPLLVLLLVSGLKVMDVPWGWDGLFSPKTILPLAILTLAPLPVVVRQTRAAVLAVQNEEYIRTARAKGLTEARVMFGHMLRPVLAPVLTAIGLVAITLINGALFVELIFGIPGFGGLTLQGLLQVDYPVIMATVLIGAMVVMVSNLMVDIVYPLLDARVMRAW